MDQLERYYSLIDELSLLCIKAGCSKTDLLEHPELWNAVAQTEEAVRIRHQLLVPSDREKCHGLWDLGFLTNYEGTQRVAAWAVAFELEAELSVKWVSRLCVRYSEEQPLFRAVPRLWQKVRRDKEMIDVAGFQWDDTGRLADFGNMQARLECNPHIISWLNEQYPGSPLYARLNPFDVGPELRLTLCLEAIRGVDPKWWRNLEIWPQQKPIVGRYELLECTPKENQHKYWEREVEGFGRLEVSFRRQNDGVLKGMVEEIKRPSSKRYMIGYCLHLTSEAKAGTPWDAGIASHIDGAINVYIDDAVRRRWHCGLDNGKAADATCRTHVFRVEGIPLRTIIPLSAIFFRSDCLLSDWFNDQFGDSITPD